jgi:single-stranded DNA-binding protein
VNSDNLAIIKGNLVQDPELQETQGGNSTFLTLKLAVKRYQIGADGKRDWNACYFLQVRAWAKIAERVFKEAHKGDAIIVIGETTTIPRTHADGKKYNEQIITANEISIFKSKHNNGEGVPYSSGDSGLTYSGIEKDDYTIPDTASLPFDIE